LKLGFTPQGWADYLYWQENDRGTLARVNELIRDTSRSPFTGIGKPEPLGGDLKGWWSRRITREHRLIYRVTGAGAQQSIEIASCRFHCDR
jgi:toxin YoeB